MKLKLFESVVLTRDLPDRGLSAGDHGAVVEIYDDKAVEVEFFEDSGHTKAVETIYIADLRRKDSRERQSLKTPTE
jgi:hypothetical protein